MPYSRPLCLPRSQVCEEADEERRLFIAHGDDGLDDGLHGLSQHLQAKTSGAESSSRQPAGLRRAVKTCVPPSRNKRQAFLSPFNVQRECEDLVLHPRGRFVQEAAFLDLVVRVSDQRLDPGNAHPPQLSQQRVCQSHSSSSSY